MTPEKLYKYKSPEYRNIQNLRDKKIWVPKPANFNDPFDCNRKLHGKEKYFESLGLYLNAISLRKKTARKHIWISEILKKNPSDKAAIREIEKVLEVHNDGKSIRMKFDKYEQEINDLRKNMGVLSLAEKNDNLLMWAHYADSHKGMCLEFSTELSHNGAENRLKDKEFTNKVDYNDNYPSIAEMKIFDQPQSSMQKHLFLQKATCWEYEEEWRLLMEDGGRAVTYPGKLTGIIFGAKADQKMVEEVKNATEDYKDTPRFYYSKMKKDQFGLDIIPESMP